MKVRFILFFSVLSNLLFSQLLDKHYGEFSLADSLRGSLRPERTAFDVYYYDLNLLIDFENQEIAGYNDIYYQAESDFMRLQIDLFDNMLIDSIVFSGQNLNFERVFNAVFIDFPGLQRKGSSAFFRVYYHGKPIIGENPPWDGGFTWQKDKQGNDWLGVSCEGIGASLWWPNKDHLSDEPDSMSVTCTFPADLTFVGNGTVESDVLQGDTQRTMTWKVHYPINNYNISLNIGKYVNFQDSYTAEDGEKLLLDYWVMPYNLEKAKVQFKQVQPMLGCYEKYFGKFPFWEDNYKLVETPYLGMEHQTAIAYGNDYKKGYAGYDFSGIGLDFDYIIIHESGHEYWGNLVSCQDVADLWIHEGFCTYSEALYVECMFDYNKAQEYVNAKKSSVENRMPIAGVYDVNVEGDGDMYNKGMLFLNTLRHVINNDNLWFELLKEMTTKEFAYKTINAKDVISFFNKKSGLNLNAIFEQYLYSKNLPKLYYRIEQVKGKEYTIHYRWLTDAKEFEMPIELEIGSKSIRLSANNSLQSFNYTKKKKESFGINDTKFYIDLKEY